MNALAARLLPSLSLLALLSLAVGCSGVGPRSDLVGGTCNGDGACEQRCVQNDRHWPGGYCTLHCANDDECPGGTVCIDDNNGMCAVGCAVNADCGDFGRGFVCDAVDRKGAPGGALVCRVP